VKLSKPVVALGAVDHLPLKAAVETAGPEAWQADSLRQTTFSQHRATQSLIMLFSSNWPEEPVERRSGWDIMAEPAQRVMDQIIETNYRPGGVVIRAMAAALLPGGVIPSHRDGHPSFALAHRIHVPLVTSDKVDFIVSASKHEMKEGMAYEISNLDIHAVANLGDVSRIHFIFDYVEP